MIAQNGKNMEYDSTKRSSLFMSNSHDKRNLWWQAFRKTVLEPHAIAILENPMTDKVPPEVLQLVEEKCQKLERHEAQALKFVDAIAQGKGFGQSPIFPQSIIPNLQPPSLVRCLEAEYDGKILPVQEDVFSIPTFELPNPRPGLASGFSDNAFTEDELNEIPASLTAIGTRIDEIDGQVQTNHGVHSPFLLFERTYGHAKHEIEAAMNYCAMDGAAALNAIANLYESAWPDRAPQPTARPVVFSCIIDNDLGIINHHWMSEGGYYGAPLCKFDIRDIEHFMHFLAWIEAIEEWAATHLLPDLQKALHVLVDRKQAGMGVKALPSPFSDAEKEEKLSQAMRMAFDNIPWKGERSRRTPLGVTGAMRMKSPKANSEPETVVTPLSLAHPVSSIPEQNPQSGNGENIPIAEPRTSSSSEKQHAHELQTQKDSDADLLTEAVTKVEQDRQKFTGFVLPIVPREEEIDSKDKKSRLGLSLMKSAGLPRSENIVHDLRSTSSAGLEKSNGVTSIFQVIPIANPDNAPRPATAVNSTEVRSPVQSLTSVTSKRSFSSLRKGWKTKSPNTSEFGSSPKDNGFKSKIANSLDIIKEHTTPKRKYADNSAPSSAKGAPLPTPAYDKKRFDIKTPKPTLPPTPKFIPDSFARMYSSHRPATSSQVISQESYDAKHQLPLRQYAKSPTTAVTNTTTLTSFI